MAIAPGGATPTPTADLSTRRVAGLVRVTTALVTAAITAAGWADVPAWAAWAAGLVWLPVAAALWFAEESPTPSVDRAAVGVVLDLLAVVGLLVLAPDQAGAMGVLLLPLAAAATWTAGVAPALGLVAVGAIARAAVAARHPVADPLQESLVAVVAVGVVLLATAAARGRRAAEVRAGRLRDAADLLLATTGDPLLLTDAAGRITTANPAAERVLTDPAGRALAGHGCADRLGLRHRDGTPLSCATGCALAALCADADGGEVELHRQLGEARQPLVARVVRTRDRDGRPAHLHVLRDITHLRQAEEAKTMFLATASHELKTPLTVIRGFAQLLRGTAVEPQHAIALEAIESRSAELASIVDRLLMSSRIDAGRIDLVLGRVDVAAVVRTRLARHPDAIREAVALDLPAEAPALANEQAVATTVDQLLDNALKFSPGDAAIRIAVDVDDDAVRLEVADLGIGMSPVQVERCFEQFWQAETSDVRRFGGTGIGLYIVRSLVEGMGGQVEVRSTLGVGTTAVVRLAHPAPATPTAPSRRRTDPTPAPEEALATVDDFMTHLGLREAPGRRGRS